MRWDVGRTGLRVIGVLGDGIANAVPEIDRIGDIDRQREIVLDDACPGSGRRQIGVT